MLYKLIGKLFSVFYKLKLGERFPKLRRIYLKAIRNHTVWMKFGYNGMEKLWYCVPLSDYIVSSALYPNKGFEPKVMNYLFKRFKRNSVFLDVGAHVGSYAIPAANVLKEGLVYAIEPRTDLYLCLAKSVQRNEFKNVFAIRAAASNQNVNKKDLLCFLRNSSGNRLVNNHLENDQDTFIEEVGTIRLDSLFEKVDFVKIDVEGSELSVLEGMTQLLQKNPNMKLIIECFDPIRVFTFLHSYGFKMKRIDKDYYWFERW